MLNSSFKISLLLISNFFSILFVFLLQIIIAQNLTPAIYGSFNSALAIIVIFLPIASGFGITQYWLKIGGKDLKNFKSIFPESINYIILLSLISVFIIILLSILSYRDFIFSTILLGLIIYLYSLIFTEIIFTIYQINENNNGMVFWIIFPNFIRLIIIVIIYTFLNELDFSKVIYAYLFSSLIIIYVSLLQIKKIEQIYFYSFFTNYNFKKLYKNTNSFGFSSIFYFIYYQGMIVIVKFFENSYYAGIYSISINIIFFIFLIPTVIFQKYYLPKIHKWANHNIKNLKIYFKISSIISFIAGTIIGLLLFLSSEFIVLYCFGKQYVESIIFLKILSISIPIRYLIINYGTILNVKNYIKTKTKILFVFSILNIVIFSVILYYFTLTESVVWFIICEIMLLFSYFVTSYKIIKNLN